MSCRRIDIKMTFKANLALTLFVIAITLLTGFCGGSSAEETSVEILSASQSSVVPGNDLFSGALTYSFPIKVPPGRKDIMPNIALAYNSKFQNSWLGQGWNLDMGAVQRSIKRGVEYNSSDFALSLNGVTSELIEIGNNNYAPEVESDFSKYTFNPQTGGFVQTTREGLKYYFGSSVASRQQDPTDASRVFKWCLDRVEDTNGNYMTISYSKDGGQIYLARIDYTGNDNLSGSLGDTYYSVVFQLEAQPRNDVIVSFLSGFQVSTNYRLSDIKVQKYNGSEKIRRYHIAYQNRASYQVSRIEGIEVFGSNDITPLPATSFTWYDGGDGTFANSKITSGLPQNEYVIYGNLNNDGMQDFVSISATTGKCSFFLSNGDGTFTKQVATSTLDSNVFNASGMLLSDLDGDGIDDLFVYSDFFDMYSLGPWSGNAQILFTDFDGQGNITFTESYLLYAYDHSRFSPTPLLADFNGDGKTDILARFYWDLTPAIYISNGNRGFDRQLLYDMPVYYILRVRSDGIGDINGDGYADYLEAIQESDGSYTFTTFFGTPTGIFSSPHTYQTGPTSLWIRSLDLADLNGDGLADLIIQWQETNVIDVRLSDGSGEKFYPISTTLQRYANGYGRFVDIDGDGSIDFVNVNPSSNSARVTLIKKEVLSSFGLTIKDTGLLTFSTKDISIADVNGDGRSDLINYDIVNAKLSVRISNGSDPNDYLATISNGLGGSTAIEYDRLTKEDNPDLPFNQALVSSVTTNDGFGVISTSSYEYFGGEYSFSDREFRGFYRVAQTNPNNTRSDTWFHQDHYKNGKIFQTDSYDSSNNLLGITTVTWDDTTDLGYGRRFVKLASKRSESYDVETFFTQSDYWHHDDSGYLWKTTSSGTGAAAVKTEKIYKNLSEASGGWLWRLQYDLLKDQSNAVVTKTTYDYYQDGTGNLKSKESWLDNKGPYEVVDPKISYTYYSETGNLKTVTDPMGYTTTYEYDPVIKTLTSRITSPPTNSGSVSHIVENTAFDYRFGTTQIAKDENNNQVIYSYDEYGRNYQVDYPDGGQVYKEFHSEVFPPYVFTRTKEDTAGNHLNKYQYSDGLGRIIQSVTPGPSGYFLANTIYYDSMGRADCTEGPYRTTSYQWPSNPTDTVYPWSEKKYDDLGRVYETRSGDETYGTLITSTTYENTAFGAATTFIDPDNKYKTEISDYRGNIRQVIEYPQGAIGPFYNTFYEYNLLNLLTKVTDALQTETIISYDSLGRKRSLNDPDMGSWQYEYDPNNNLKKKTDAKNQYVEITYDELNRILTRTYSDPNTPTATYTYDQVVPNGKGRLGTVSNSEVTTIYDSYDEMGRVLSQTKMFTELVGDYQSSFTYDLVGKIVTMTYPDGYLLSYDYYPGTGLLDQVYGVSDFQQYAHYEYDPSGQTGTINYGNNVSRTDYTFDRSSGRLKEIQTFDSSSQNLIYRTYEYSPAGDINRINDLEADIQYDYYHDNLHRLTGEVITGAGASPQNPLTLINTPYPAGPGIIAGQPVHAVDTVDVNGSPYSYTYDANGNQTSGPDLSDPDNIGTRTITYNGENMPVNISGPLGIINLVYDADNLRAKKEVSGGSSTYYIGSHFELINGVVVKYILSSGQRIAMVTGPDQSATIFFHKDHLGSSAIMTDINGLEVGRSNYEPFGAERGGVVGITATNYKYTGQEHDPEAGLYNYNARLYDPATGMFVSSDSIIPNFSDPQALNRYNYCRNNPLGYVDPSGHFWEFVAVGFVVGALSAGAMSDWEPEAMLVGGVIGAISGGAGSWGSGLVTGEIGGAIAGGAVAGATAGGLSAAYYGGNVGKAMAKGAMYGAIGGAVFGSINTYGEGWNPALKVAANSAAGGGMAELQGGEFVKGAAWAGGAALAMVGWQNARKFTDDNLMAGGNDIVMNEQGEYRTDGTTKNHPNGPNSSGDVWDSVGFEGMGEQGGPHKYDKYPEVARFINHVSKAHDYGNGWGYVDGYYWDRGYWGNSVFQTWSFSSMVPAAVFTSFAFSSQQYQPMYYQK